MYFTDEPITKSEEDIFGREVFVNNLANDINRWSGKGSLVLALYGPWGTGKSSVLNLLKQYIENKNAGEIIAFDPWYFNSTEQLIQTFFAIIKKRTIAIASQEDQLKLENKFTKYGDYLSKAFTSVKWEPEFEIPLWLFGKIKIRIDKKKKDERVESPEDIKEDLRGILKKLNRKFVILIDNLDRLDPPELLLMFKLVRLCSDFPNFVFVLAFDHKQVTKLVALKDIDPDFLDKIIQIDIGLPLIDQDEINKFIRSSFQKIIDTHNLRLSQATWDRFAQIYDQVLSINLINNIRTAKRYLNSVSFTIPILREEVDFADFLVLEAVRVFFPRVYMGLPKRKKDLTSFDSAYGLDAMRRIRLAEQQAIRDWIVKELPDKDDVQICERLIGFLFPSIGAFFQNPTNPSIITREDIHLANQRICVDQYFDRYFMFRIPEGEISSNVISTILDNLNSDTTSPEETTPIVLGEKERLSQLLTKLNYHVNSINLTGRAKLIRILGSQGDVFEWELLNSWNASGPTGTRLVIKCFETLERSDDLWNAVADIISSTPSLAFASDLIAWFLSDEPPVFIKQQMQQKDMENLISIIKKRLQEEVLEPKQNIFATYPKSYYRILAVLRSEKIMGTRDIGTNYVYEQLTIDPNALPKLLIMNATFNLPTYTIHSFEFERLQGDYDVEKLFAILEKQEASAAYSQIEQEAINAFKKFMVARNNKSDTLTADSQ